MHKVRLKLSDQLDESSACQLTEGLINIALSSATMREDNKQSAPWVIEWLLKDKPEPSDIIARISLQAAAHNISNVGDITPEHLDIEEISDDTNWLEESYQGFEPFTIGSFFIHGSHYEGEIPDQQVPIQLDAATAFGSGEHETTKGCMLAMLELKAKGVCPWNILDMGTGSGILAMIAWRLWTSPTLCVDNQAESIRVTDRHAKMNGIKLSPSCLTTAVGDGFNTPQVDKNKP